MSTRPSITQIDTAVLDGKGDDTRSKRSQSSALKRTALSAKTREVLTIVTSWAIREC